MRSMCREEGVEVREHVFYQFYKKYINTRPEPTGVEYSVTNFLPLPCPLWETISTGTVPYCKGWDKRYSRSEQAPASSAKAHHIRYSRSRVADRRAACSGAERIAPRSSNCIWSLA